MGATGTVAFEEIFIKKIIFLNTFTFANDNARVGLLILMDANTISPAQPEEGGGAGRVFYGTYALQECKDLVWGGRLLGVV